MRMTKMASIVGALAALLLVTELDAEAMRCRNRLVSRDDSRAKVIALCGSPIDTSSYMIYGRSGHFRQDLFALTRGRYVVRHGFRGPEIEIPVQVDEWVYNFGRNRLMRRVVFANGRVERIHTLGYGYDTSGAAWPGTFNDPPALSPRAPQQNAPRTGYDVPRSYDEARPGHDEPRQRSEQAQPPAAEPPPRRVFVEPAPEVTD